MRFLRWLKSLPECDDAPSRRVALWLFGAALLAWPIDIAISRYGERHWESFTYVENGIRYLTVARPYWVGLARMALCVIAVTLLIVVGRVARRDLGLTFGKAKTTIIWIIVP